MDVDGDSIKFLGRKKPDRLLGKVERSWTRAAGSGVPAPPPTPTPHPVWAQGRWRWAAHVGLKP